MTTMKFDNRLTGKIMPLECKLHTKLSEYKVGNSQLISVMEKYNHSVTAGMSLHNTSFKKRKSFITITKNTTSPTLPNIPEESPEHRLSLNQSWASLVLEPHPYRKDAPISVNSLQLPGNNSLNNTLNSTLNK